MFRVEFSSRAKREFDRLNEKKVEDALKVLMIDPLPARCYDVKKLKGLSDTFRIRIGKIRIVYTIIWKDRIVLISRISSRENIYD